MVVWLVGAACVALMSVACGLTLGGRVSKGEANVWTLDVATWAIGFHGGMGVLALYLVMRGVR
jgi:hypothetical protein